MDPIPWRDAWHTALYAAGLGFYVTRGGPAAHFTTATHGVTGAVLADALLRLWGRSHDDPPKVVVDIGAGRGELLTHLLSVESAIGVDVVDRPEALDPRIGWIRSPGGARLPDGLHGLQNTLVIAHEWLDVVPCTIAEVDARGRLREVLVDPLTGEEQLGGDVDPQDAEWAADHWPGHRPGQRVEVGRTRDAAWADLVSRVDSGLLVAIDYGHVKGARPPTGTLTAYRAGSLVTPVPDGSCDLTAHVAMDSLDAHELVRQREVLRGLGVRATGPEHVRASDDPMGYLRALERASAEAELIRPGGFGDFWWAVKRVEGPDVP